jgi:AcrR family transcriptional regulator
MHKLAVQSETKPAVSGSRERLLEAASRVFAQAGLRGATTRGIAEAAGVNEITLFRLFGTKERLLAAVLERAATVQADALADDQLWTGELERDLRRYAELFNAVLEQNEHLIRTLIGEARRYPEQARQLIFEAVQSSRKCFIAYLDAAAKRGAIRPDVDVAAAGDAFTGMLLSGMLRRPNQRKLGYSSETYVSSCVEIFVRGIRADAVKTISTRKAGK